MFHGKKVVVVMPAYNAAQDARADVPRDPAWISSTTCVVTDDASRDDTVEVARRLGLHTLVPRAEPRLRRQPEDLLHARRCRSAPTSCVMLHPDYQYTPKLLPAMVGADRRRRRSTSCSARASSADARSRAACRSTSTSRTARSPPPQNLLCGAKLSEYHTGYRAFTRECSRSLPLLENSDDFVFDNQMLAQILVRGLRDRRGELPGRLLRGGVVDQLLALGALRARRAVDLVPGVLAAQRAREVSALRSARTPPRPERSRRSAPQSRARPHLHG